MTTINRKSLLSIGGMHVLALPIFFMATTSPFFQAFLFLSMHLLAGFGVTCGMHRLWAHRAYEASKWVKYFFLAGATMAFEGSVLFWAKMHRLHHRHSDTDLDPHNINRGFWYAHVLCYILSWPKEMTEAYAKVNVDDLRSDPVLRWQNKHFFKLAPIFSLLLPAIVSFLLAGEFWYGLVLGAARVCFTWHMTWTINSFGHTIGRRTYDLSSPAGDSHITAIASLGEGYHNFHHAYQADWRGNAHLGGFNPSTWLILFLAKLGFVSRLREVHPEKRVIFQGQSNEVDA